MTPPQPTPGYTTTEFWASAFIVLVNQVLVLLTVFGAIHLTDAQTAAVVAVCESLSSLVVGLYTVSRSGVKSATAGSSPQSVTTVEAQVPGPASTMAKVTTVTATPAPAAAPVASVVVTTPTP